MAEILKEISKAAKRAVKMSRDRGGAVLDYAEASIVVVEEILAEAAEYSSEMTEEQLRTLAEDFGCYVLEIARKAYGGAYAWHDRDLPVLVVGEPVFHVAMIT